MAWFGLDKLLLGTDLDAEQLRSNQLDSAIQAANQQLQQQGYITQQQVDAAAANIVAGNASTGADNVVGSVNAEFVAGAQQGFQAALKAPGWLVGFLGDSLSTAVWGVIKSIPWWVWLVAAGALFVWMGGLSLLRGRLARS